MILRILPGLLQGTLKIIPQKGTPTYYPKRTPEDGLIDWEEMDVFQVYNFVRAQTRPYPGAFAIIEGKKYTLWRCRVFDTRLTYKDAEYGDIVEQFGDKIVIKCRGGLLLLDEYER
ncbi:MAG: hypothetical protein GY757_18485 [bacterium]|nr:hypothetical protein [bacterium]